MSSVSHHTQASKSEKHAREKEEKFAAETKAISRKQELNQRIGKIGQEEIQVCSILCCKLW